MIQKNEIGGLACMGQRRYAYRVSVRKPEGNTSLGGPEFGWEANIKMDLKERGLVAWTVFIRQWMGTSGRSCECRDETLCSIKCRELLVLFKSTQFLRNCVLLNKNSAPRN